VRVAADDPAINVSSVEFPGDPGTLLGYLAYPKATGQFPVVLVCHENRGLTDHIKDVTRRVAKAGYVGLAVDLLSRQGGTDKLASDAVPGALGNITPLQFVKDFVSGHKFLTGKTYAKPDRFGMVGFCFGGGVTWSVATLVPSLLAAVPFYGPPPPETDLPKIKADRDTRITGTAAAIEAAMKKNNQVYEKMIYPNTDHAFHNDTGTRYAAEAAQDAWKKTIAWFDKYVK
jgi:carboxymethylenebutenolidase